MDDASGSPRTGSMSLNVLRPPTYARPAQVEASPNTQISTPQIVGCRLQGEEDLHSTTSSGHLPVDDPQNGISYLSSTQNNPTRTTTPAIGSHPSDASPRTTRVRI